MGKLQENLEELSRDHKRAKADPIRKGADYNQTVRITELGVFLSNIIHDPLEDKTIQGAIKSWATISGAKNNDAHTSFINRIAHQHIMLANASAWSWIIQVCNEEVEATIVQRGSGRKAWMQLLIKSVHTFYHVSYYVTTIQDRLTQILRHV